MGLITGEQGLGVVTAPPSGRAVGRVGGAEGPAAEGRLHASRVPEVRR